MSEYQRYEFIAIDRPLTPRDMSSLRAISTRAEITPTSFTNVYSFGDLKADTAGLLASYFDAHLYFANWGSRRLILRLPAARVDLRRLKPYFPGGAARIKTVKAHVVIDLHSESEDPEDRWHEGGHLGVLATLRDQILRGDMTLCYLAWLLAVQEEDVPSSRREPRVPAGLSEPGEAAEILMEFLRIDPDLVAAAAEASEEDEEDTVAFLRWVKSLPASEKERLLLLAASEPDRPIGSDMLSSFRTQRPATGHRGRTVSQILRRWDAHRSGDPGRGWR